MIKKIITGVITFVLCSCVLLCGAYAYLTNKTKNSTEKKVKAEKTDEPYEKSLPDDAGVLISMDDELGILVYLDFEDESIKAVITDDVKKARKGEYGYTVDYTVYADFNLLSGFVDRIGGIDIEIEEEKVRLTGVQVAEYLSDNDTKELRKEVIKAITSTISSNDITRSDLVYIIENCDSTELSLPDCFYWSEYLGEMCKNVTVVDMT